MITGDAAIPALLGALFPTDPAIAGNPARLLVWQAHLLNMLFNRGVLASISENGEIDCAAVNFTLRAQSQCRQTVELAARLPIMQARGDEIKMQPTNC